MINEKFADGTSWIHRLDPRLKIIVTIILAFTVALGNNINMLLQAMVLAIILLIITNLNFKSVAGRLLIVNTFIFFIWLFIPFTYPGEGLFKIGPLLATREGIIYALKITIRSNTIMLFVISLLSTSSISALIHALNDLYLPDKLVYLFFFVYRYLHVIEKEFEKLSNSMSIRAFKPRTNLHTYKSYAYLIGMLLIKSYERSKKVYEAMLCRGFKGKFYIFDDFSLDRYDLLFTIICLSFIIYSIFIERGWIGL